jgi:hypothetical protein
MNWLIALLSFAGLAGHLVRIPGSVLEKTRLRTLATAEARRRVANIGRPKCRAER